MKRPASWQSWAMGASRTVSSRRQLGCWATDGQQETRVDWSRSMVTAAQKVGVGAGRGASSGREEGWGTSHAWFPG
jgi:hypothetical protein